MTFMQCVASKSTILKCTRHMRWKSRNTLIPLGTNNMQCKNSTTRILHGTTPLHLIKSSFNIFSTKIARTHFMFLRFFVARKRDRQKLNNFLSPENFPLVQIPRYDYQLQVMALKTTIPSIRKIC